jgi:nitroreductase
MDTHITAVGSLSADQVRSVLVAATAAPSLHNSQPWRFRCTPTAIELYADTGRAVPVADPDHRELLLSCGAALLNLRVAIRALGVHPAVQLLPSTSDPDLLAIVRPQGHSVITPADRYLSAAISRRRTNRRQFSAAEVPVSLLTALRQAAKIEQAWMVGVAGSRLPILHRLVNQAHHLQRDDPAFTAEWSRWTGRGQDSVDGVPSGSSGPLPEPQDQWVLRDYSAGQARSRVAGKDFEPEPLIAVISTFHDLPLARLQAGQGMQRVLLAATNAGLSASFLSQVVEVPATRKRLRDEVAGGLWPQVVLRLGFGSPVPCTPRRAVEDVVGKGETLTEASRSC